MTSERPTADVVADLRVEMLRALPERHRLNTEAADRLEHFDTYRRTMEAQAKERDALRPECPTCGGTGTLGERDYFATGADPCPDCHDGKMPFERIVAEWQAGRQA